MAITRLRYCFLGRSQGQLRTVVGLAQMRQHQDSECWSHGPSKQQRPILSAEMPHTGADTLLQRQGIRPVFQHLQIVIEFDDEGITALQPCDNQLRDLARIGAVAKCLMTVAHHKADGIVGIVGSRERADCKSSKDHRLASVEFPQIRKLAEPSFTAPVGSFQANARGLFDLSGNVQEWVDDEYSRLGTSVLGVLRGGGWNSYQPENLFTGSRNAQPPDYKDSIYGFRVVLAKIPPKED